MCSISDSTSDEPESCWLVRDNKVLASVVVPSNGRERGRGLLGRDEFEGAMLISPARSVHTVRMRFSIDVALLDADGVVLKVLSMRPNRMSLPVRGCRSVLEAQAGAFHAWNLAVGDELEIRHTRDGEHS